MKDKKINRNKIQFTVRTSNGTASNGMKNLMLFVHPSKDFLEEQKTSIKIQIDNCLSLGWKREDIMLATNFPYEYNGVKSLLVSDDNYSSFCPTVSIINVIVELFERKLIKKGEIYWFHDLDAYQSYEITEAELNLGEADIALAERGTKPKMDTGIIFFKNSAEDIFRRLKETCHEYQVNEEYALMALFTNNLLWITEAEYIARTNFVPLNISGNGNLPDRFNKLDLCYNFGIDSFSLIYHMAKKPIKVAHFHYSIDLLLDSAMYGKNSMNKPLIPERLIKIFHKHGVKGIYLKKMKNLMIYINPEKKFLHKAELLMKVQIDNSLKLDWEKEDIILITNFPYEYQGIKATVLDGSVFDDINVKAHKSNTIFHLLDQGVVKETEFWWYHDLDVFQLRKIKSPEIDLEDTTAGFMLDGSGKLDTGSFFFRKDSNKIFEWIRNRTCRLNTDEATALMSLAATNYRNINTMYKKINISYNFAKHL